MKEKPIIFSGPMVSAILEGRKTQTRRVVKPQPDGSPYWTFHKEIGAFFPANYESKPAFLKCPYGQTGDRLWVRETFEYCVRGADYPPGFEDYVAYRADNGAKMITPGLISTEDINGKWRPSIHMPRWASRITLEVTGVRMERLQDITREDANAEGYEKSRHSTSIFWFQELWTSINGPESWASNSWVWIVEFKVVEE